MPNPLFKNEIIKRRGSLARAARGSHDYFYGWSGCYRTGNGANSSVDNADRPGVVCPFLTSTRVVGCSTAEV